MIKKSKTLKILMISPTPFFADRGCHIRIYEEAIALKRRGHEVDIVTYHLGRDIFGVNIIRIPNLLFWYKKLEAGPSWWKPILDFFLLVKILKLMTYKKYNIIHAHLHEGGALGIMARLILRQNIPIVLDYQGSLTGEVIAHQFVQKFSFLIPMFRYIERLINLNCNYIITSSTAASQYLKVAFPLIKKSKVSVFLDQVEKQTKTCSRFCKSKLKKKLGIKKNKIIIGYLGLLTKYQGVDLLLDAIKIIKTKRSDIQYLIMGYPNIDFYQELSKKKKIDQDIIFSGRIAYENIYDYLSLVNIAIAPKLTTTESNGKILNYMAAGLPIVAFDTKTNRELCKKGALLVKPLNSIALSRGILKLLNNPKMATNYAKSAKRAIRNLYSWDKFVIDLEKIYNKLLSA